MLRFPVLVIIDARPRNYGPVVIDLPVKGAHAIRPSAAIGFHGFLHAVALHDKADIDEIFEVFRRMIIHFHVFFDRLVADTAFLMRFHHIGVDIEIFFFGKRANGLHFGKGLESEFAGKAGQPVRHRFERHASVP